MRVTVDASVFGLVILRQTSPGHIDRIEQFLDSVDLVQPAHWPLELAGLTVRSAREKRLAADDRLRMRGQLRDLIAAAEVDGHLPAPAVFDVAMKHHLSVYDAAYLELVLRNKLPLLTGDGSLGKAARRAGIDCIDLP